MLAQHSFPSLKKETRKKLTASINWKVKKLTHGCVVGVGEALVHPLPHEHPGVAGEVALDDLVVVLSQLFGGLWDEDMRT